VLFRSFTASSYQTTLNYGYRTDGNYATPIDGLNFSGGSNLVIPSTAFNTPRLDFTFPPATFLMQDGSVGPIHPTYTGSFVYDTALKKWGKQKNNFKRLIDYTPVNNSQDVVSYTNFGMTTGLLDASGSIKLFTTTPADSYMRYGKIGYYRKGYSQAHEIVVHFRTPSDATVVYENSFDGRTLEYSSYVAEGGVDLFRLNMLVSGNGRWHSVTVKGNYDLSYMEFRGTINGRR